MLNEVRDNQTLQELLACPEDVVLLEFYQPDDERCRELEPILRDYQKEWHGLAKFYRSAVGQNDRLAEQHEVRKVPTLIFYLHGRQVNRLECPDRPEEIRMVLEELCALTGT